MESKVLEEEEGFFYDLELMTSMSVLEVREVRVFCQAFMLDVAFFLESLEDMPLTLFEIECRPCILRRYWDSYRGL